MVAVQIGAQRIGGELFFPQSGSELGNVPGGVGGHTLPSSTKSGTGTVIVCAGRAIVAPLRKRRRQ